MPKLTKKQLAAYHEKNDAEEVFVVTLTETQMKVIERACNAFGRLYMGQIDTPVMDCWERNPYVLALYEADKEEYFRRREALQKLCDMASNMSHKLGENASYGIFSSDIHPEAQISYEIETDIRYFLWCQRSAADREATKHTVLSSPGLKVTQQPRLIIVPKTDQEER